MNMMATTTASSSKEEENRLSATAKQFCRRFSLAEIHLATEGFSDAHLIGKGGFGKVYKGIMNNGQVTVAIKRQSPNSNQGVDEFLMEIETLSKVRHVNLVSLIGYCNENAELILVYEYIAYGTLADHLYKLPRNNNSEDCSSITWNQRLKICIGAGRGLDYLHTGTSIIHRDVKSTNILLDENFKAKVSDFGLAKHLSTSNSQSHVSTIVKGSFGYLDPNYFITGRLTRKSDTYAFGMIMLEVLSGRPAVDPGLPEYGGSLVLWAQEKINKGKIDQIVASNLRDKISSDCLKTFVGVAKRCLHHEPEKRPTMAQVVAQLELAFEQQERKASTHNASRFLTFWSRGNRGTVSTEKDKQTVTVQPIAIPLHELKDITANFSLKFSICQGPQELVFRGVLKSGQMAAIKLLKFTSWTDQEFLAQVSILSSLKHDNVTKLLGYCVEGVLQFLVYEFAPHGSLYDILHGWRGLKHSKPAGLALSWTQRVKIAVGAAKGLEYFHEKGHIHRNIKSSNVLLFDDQVGKIDYFGHSIQFSYKGQYEGHFTFRDWLPHGYHPPEYTSPRCVLSWRGDVYSFGVVLLELLTGRRPFDPSQNGALVKWVEPYIKVGKVQLCVDAKLGGDYPPEAAAKMAEVAAMCVENEAKIRPKMSWVVKALCPLLEAEDRKEEGVVNVKGFRNSLLPGDFFSFLHPLERSASCPELWSPLFVERMTATRPSAAACEFLSSNPSPQPKTGGQTELKKTDGVAGYLASASRFLRRKGNKNNSNV